MFLFVCNSILLGIGLAMDAFSVSMANGLQDPGMSRKRMFCMAGTYAGFQFLMPVIGWACVRTVAGLFAAFQKMIPWIAFFLLGWIGGKMLLEGIRGTSVPGPGERESGSAAFGGGGKEPAAGNAPGRGKKPEAGLSAGELLVQGIATSIDALSVGFTIAAYSAARALAAALIIAGTTLVICLAGIRIGRYFGMRLAGKASVLGGVILLAIGCRILLGGA